MINQKRWKLMGKISMMTRFQILLQSFRIKLQTFCIFLLLFVSSRLEYCGVLKWQFTTHLEQFGHYDDKDKFDQRVAVCLHSLQRPWRLNKGTYTVKRSQGNVLTTIAAKTCVYICVKYFILRFNEVDSSTHMTAPWRSFQSFFCLVPFRLILKLNVSAANDFWLVVGSLFSQSHCSF